MGNVSSKPFPTEGKPKIELSLDHKKKELQEIQKGHLIICRDFNAPMYSVMDTSKKEKTSRSGLANIFSAEDMYDPWRCLHTTKDHKCLLLLKKKKDHKCLHSQYNVV